MGKIYITSDLHFYHKSILKHCPNTRPFADVEDMNEKLIEQINNCLIGAGDHLYILGDFSFKGKERTREVLEKLPCGKITLILGNHDLHFEGFYKKYFHEVQRYKEIRWYDEEGEKIKVCLFHFPIQNWNQMGRGAVHLHGHLHSNFYTGIRRRDVGYDSSGRIYSLDEVMKDCLKEPSNLSHH